MNTINLKKHSIDNLWQRIINFSQTWQPESLDPETFPASIEHFSGTGSMVHLAIGTAERLGLNRESTAIVLAFEAIRRAEIIYAEHAKLVNSLPPRQVKQEVEDENNTSNI